MIETKVLRAATVGLAAMVLSNCDSAPIARKGESRIVTSSTISDWYHFDEDDYHDGAIRTRVATARNARALSIRCFRAGPQSTFRRTDLRYTIEVSLLGKLAGELAERKDLQLVVVVDEIAVAVLSTRAVVHDFGISFLSPLEPWLIDKLATARRSIAVVPRQGEHKLDQVTRFGVGGLAALADPVKEACDLPRSGPPGGSAFAGRRSPPAKTPFGHPELPAIPDPSHYRPAPA